MNANPVPSEVRKEGRPASLGEKVALWLIVIMVVYLFWNQ